jgi:hypothetical protein
MTVLLAVLSGGMIAAQMMSRQKMRWAALVLLPFAAVGGIGRGQQDAVEVLRWRARVFETRAFKERWMDTLRPLVDRYSTRADLFLVDNDNPYWLYLPLRKGWTTESDALKDANFADYQRSGARFFLSYNSRTPPRSMHAELLGSSDYFKLYCLDAKGCKPLSSSTEAPRQRPM